MNRLEAVVAPMSWRGHPAVPPVRPELVAPGNAVLSGQRTFVIGADEAGERTASVTAATEPAGEIVALRLADGIIHIDAAAAMKPDDRPDWRDHADPGSRQLAWGLAASQALTLLQQVFRGPVDVVDILAKADPANPVFWVQLTIAPTGADAGAGSSRLILGLTGVFLDRLAALPRRADPRQLSRWLAQWSGIHGTVRVKVPGPVLTPTQIRGLARHDVLVLGRRAAIETDAVRLCLDGSRGNALDWPVRLIDNARAQVTGPAVIGHCRNAQQENPVTNEASPPPEGAAVPEGETAPLASPVERLPIQVEFDLGRMDLPLNQLAQIEPGYVFALPQALEQARVAIRLNGTLAGTGELVSIGDVLGVRLTAWTNGPDID